MSVPALRSYRIFEDFNEEELAAMSQGLVRRKIPQGFLLIEEGSEGHSLFILKSGSVDVIKQSDSPRNLPLISRLLPGSIFGEISMLGRPPRTAKVIANEPSTVLELPYAFVEKMVVSRPELGVKIYRAIALSLTEKVGKTTQDLVALIASARMAALGEMTSGISHEINNPLSTISLLAEAVEEMSAAPSPDLARITDSASKIGKSVRRIGKIITGLRAVARNAEDDPLVPVSLHEVLEDTRSFCEARFLNHQVKLEFSPCPPALMVPARGAQLCQVLLNLLNNSHDAVKGTESPWVKVTTERAPGTLRILVTDSGPGISAEIRKKIFHPFYTTKPYGKGTGLGLSISRQILENHAGTLELDEKSANTCFVMTLPCPG